MPRVAGHFLCAARARSLRRVSSLLRCTPLHSLAAYRRIALHGGEHMWYYGVEVYGSGHIVPWTEWSARLLARRASAPVRPCCCSYQARVGTAEGWRTVQQRSNGADSAPSSNATRQHGPLSNPSGRAFDVVAMAASLGGLDALSCVLGALPPDFPVPVLVVQHLSARYPSYLVDLLGRRCALSVTWARHGQFLRPGMIYVAPPDQHLLVGRTRMVRLAQTPHVEFVRPSADVLFESVAATYRARAIAVVLTGSRRDGARGACSIKRAGGRVLVQDEATCAAFGMPQAAIAANCVDFALPLPAVAPALVALTMVPGAAALLDRPSRVAS